MSAMLREPGLLIELAKANERIRQLEAERVPDGWMLVPIKPTQDMVDAALRRINGYDLQFYGANELRKEIAEDWGMMLAAVPQPKKEGV